MEEFGAADEENVVGLEVAEDELEFVDAGDDGGVGDVEVAAVSEDDVFAIFEGLVVGEDVESVVAVDDDFVFDESAEIVVVGFDFEGRLAVVAYNPIAKHDGKSDHRQKLPFWRGFSRVKGA